MNPPRCVSGSFRESIKPSMARLRVSGPLSPYLVSTRARLSYHFPRRPRLQRRWFNRASSTSSSRSYSFRTPRASAPFCTMRVRTWPVKGKTFETGGMGGCATRTYPDRISQVLEALGTRFLPQAPSIQHRRSRIWTILVVRCGRGDSL